MSVDLIEALSEAAHAGWMEGKRAQGVGSRISEWGEEFMVPYSEMSERAKDIDRAAVRSVVDAIRALGYTVVTVDPAEREEWKALEEADTLHLLPIEAHIASVKHLAARLLDMTDE